MFGLAGESSSPDVSPEALGVELGSSAASSDAHPLMSTVRTARIGTPIRFFNFSPSVTW
jgi:hypothetical protein